jgi:hypothetical protein
LNVYLTNLPEKWSLAKNMMCGLQNRRVRVFPVFLHLQWISLLFAVSPLRFFSFLQHTTPQKEQNK